MEIYLYSITNYWINGKGTLGELFLTDEYLVFNKKGFMATYRPRSIVGAISSVVHTQAGVFEYHLSEIVSAERGRFRLNSKALIVKTTDGLEHIFAISDKHKKWFSILPEMIEKAKSKISE